ncbi:MAG: inositol monophosphatase family protein [Pseudomonadota bacterium]
MAQLSALMNVMVQAALKAGRRLKRDFGEVENLQVSVKGPADFVSNADRQAEKIVYEELKKARPKWGFLMEESGEEVGEDPQHRWIIDPLDGTTNFLHSIPHFAISIALESQGQLMAGLVYNPVSEELFTAERGKGAFLNDRRMRVANRKTLATSVIGTGIPHIGRPEHGKFILELAHLMGETAGIRRSGAASLDLAYVASGRFDGFWEHGLAPWDVAAGMLLISEAGGFVSDLDGGQKIFQTGGILCGNEPIQKKLLAALKTGRQRSHKSS